MSTGEVNANRGSMTSSHSGDGQSRDTTPAFQHIFINSPCKYHGRCTSQSGNTITHYVLATSKGVHQDGGAEVARSGCGLGDAAADVTDKAVAQECKDTDSVENWASKA